MMILRIVARQGECIVIPTSQDDAERIAKTLREYSNVSWVQLETTDNTIIFKYFGYPQGDAEHIAMNKERSNAPN